MIGCDLIYCTRSKPRIWATVSVTIFLYFNFKQNKVTDKGGLKSESQKGFSNLPKLVPKTILVLFNAVQSVDKMTNVYLFVFTGLIYSHGLQIEFRIIMKYFIIDMDRINKTRKVFGIHFGRFENPPSLSDFKPPLR